VELLHLIVILHCEILLLLGQPPLELLPQRQLHLLGLRQLRLQFEGPAGSSLQVLNALLMLLTKPAYFTGRHQVGKLSFERGDAGGGTCVRKMLKAKQQKERGPKIEESGFT
jgi:hypothetical protein